MMVWELIGIVILLAFALGIMTVISRGRFYHRRRPGGMVHHDGSADVAEASDCRVLFPDCWMVVKGRDLLAVQFALSLHKARFCTWMEGLTEADSLFIAPAIKGWILVTGSRLPDPSEDPDACFRFVRDLSRKLGKVQLFSANRSLHHHAWVKAETGRVVRAYAWAGTTVWTQGAPTRAEMDLGLTCFEYAEPLPDGLPAGTLERNVEKVPLLAARWGLDPARIQEHFLLKEHGVAGKPAHRY